VITLSAEATDILRGSFTYHVAVESWLNGALLADSIPVDDGGEEIDRSLRVPERAVFTIPRVADGVDWTPSLDNSPLAANGQRLHVKLGIGLSGGRVEWFARRRLLIQESQAEDDRVTVSAVGLLALIDEARLVSPYQPNNTLGAALRGLLEPALTALIDSALVDRTAPTAVNWDEDRLGAVFEVLDAWPATAAVDPEGFLQVLPVSQSTTAVLSITDTGSAATLIESAGSSTRDGAYNAVVARGTQSDGAQVQGTAYLTGGPKSAYGPFNPLPVPKFFSSPLLTTIAQCNAAAATMAARLQRETSREYRVTTVPHPALQEGDVVSLTSSRLGLTNVKGTVEVLSLPYVPAEGSMPAMALTVRTLV